MAESLLGQWMTRPDNPKAIIEAIVRVFGSHPRAVVERCVNPVTGLAKSERFFSIAALTAWFERETRYAHLARIEDGLKTGRIVAYPAGGRPPPGFVPLGWPEGETYRPMRSRLAGPRNVDGGHLARVAADLERRRAERAGDAPPEPDPFPGPS